MAVKQIKRKRSLVFFTYKGRRSMEKYIKEHHGGFVKYFHEAHFKELGITERTLRVLRANIHPVDNRRLDIVKAKFDELGIEY